MVSELELPAKMDEELDGFLAALLIKNYGDLLKVSRTRGVPHSLPSLRKYVAGNEYLLQRYELDLAAEIEGQGLVEDAVLETLVVSQLKALRAGDEKNNTKFADEIKASVSKGKIDVEAIKNGDLSSDKGKGDFEAQVNRVIEEPLSVEVKHISVAVANEVRSRLLASFELFSLWAFEIQMGFKFQKQDFHSIIFETAQKVVDGKLDRLVVTIPPRHSKTQLLSICLPLYSFCHNAGSHNIICSYAEDVVAESSGYIRQIMTDELFECIFPQVRIDPTKRALDRWGTTRSGVLHAVPTGGKLTGKGAGSLSPVYSGCFVVDDPIKPKDAYSNAVREEINDRFDNTFMSRLANDGCIDDRHGNKVECARTPMVVIMQRVHDDDLVGYLFRGKSSDKYHWLNIPAILTDDVGSQEYYDDMITKQGYSHAIPILYKLGRKEYPCALWPSRKSLESLIKMREANPYTFWSQYMGEPTAKGTGLIKDEWYQEYNIEDFPLDKVVHSFCTCDTASTDKDYSDYTVICHWSKMKDNTTWLKDVELDKLETPEAKQMIVDFWNKVNIYNPSNPSTIPIALYMEDKSSGQFLNQQFVREGNIRTLPVPRDKTSGNKVARFLNAVPHFAQAKFFFPANHKHSAHIRREVMNMTGLGSGTGHDDVIDNISDCAAIVYGEPSANYGAWVGGDDD